MQPLISFVIPYYKKEKTISKCLKSLFSQSVKDIEVIVVFDGEDRAALAQVKKFKNATTLVVPHGGASAARNAGADIAKGEFISFWDADSYIEPGAAAVWLQVFRKYPEVDFVYSGYRFQEGRGALESEPFDPWLLEINNYISGHFPIRRAKAPRWDESLKSLQDWDFWLQAVRAGCKGHYLQGFAFKTEYPDKDSISGSVGGDAERWLGRLELVKNKHGIPLRKGCVSALHGKADGIALAKLLDMDYRDYPTYFPNKYNLLVQIGFSPAMANVHAQNFRNDWSPGCRKVLFWRPVDVWSLRNEASLAAIEALAIVLNASLAAQFCEDRRCLDYLTSMGFKVEELALPMDFASEAVADLPEKFRVLYDIDRDYQPFIDSAMRAMPDVEFVKLQGAVNIDTASVYLRLGNDRSVDPYVKRALMSGRRVISNIQAPYCGYLAGELVGTQVGRRELIRAVRQAESEKEPDREAAEYWREACSPAKFKLALEAELAPPQPEKQAGVAA